MLKFIHRCLKILLRQEISFCSQVGKDKLSNVNQVNFRLPTLYEEKIMLNIMPIKPGIWLVPACKIRENFLKSENVPSHSHYECLIVCTRSDVRAHCVASILYVCLVFVQLVRTQHFSLFDRIRHTRGKTTSTQGYKCHPSGTIGVQHQRNHACQASARCDVRASDGNQKCFQFPPTFP